MSHIKVFASILNLPQTIWYGFNLVMFTAKRRPKSAATFFNDAILELKLLFPGSGPAELNPYSDSLRVGRSGDRIAVQTGPVAHLASLVPGIFGGCKAGGACR